MTTNRVKTLAEQVKHAALMVRTARAAGDARGVRMWTARYDVLNARTWDSVGTN